MKELNKDKAHLPNNTFSESLDAIFPVKKTMVAWEDTSGHDRFPDVYQIFRTTKIVKHVFENNHFNFHCENAVCLRLEYLTDEIIRVRYAKEADFEKDFSYAIDPTFTPIHPSINLEETPTFYRLIGKKVHCIIQKKDAMLTITDIQGNVLSEDGGGWELTQTILEGVTSISIEKDAPEKEIFYGLGDKSCALNLRGKKFENWNTDAFGYNPQSDPLYRSIPFYYGLREGKAYGIFLDNSYRSWFDFDKNHQRKMSISCEGGEMNYYFIAGPQLLEVAKRYAQLTGKAELLPMWGLGFHQCRWSYFPESRLMEVAEEFRKRRIPCDALYLDIDYMDDYRCFTVDKKHFPDMKSMTAKLQSMGFHTIVMIDPGIRVDPDYEVYQEGKEKDYFCRRKDGTVMRGPVWPQDCTFPDFTKEEVRSWWGKLYKELYNDQGISGFWNDMNEPAVFKVDFKTFPEDVRHDYEGMGAEHSRIHNIYGQQMARATMEGLADLNPDKRPVLVSRATFSGGQRFSAVWTGDNIASWEHLAIANRQCQRLSISGFSFVGTDIGGFVESPSGELLVRWLQLGVFHPFYRIHSMGNNEDGSGETDTDAVLEAEKNNRLDQEPWVFGDHWTDLAREAIELRYILQPYLYTCFWQHSQTGAPVIRQLSFYDQHDLKTLLREDEFFYGDHLLAVNIHRPAQMHKNVYLPKGNWIDYWEEKIYKGGKEYEIKISTHHIPIFIKAGSFIPHYPVRQHSSKKIKTYQLHYYYGKGKYQQEIFEDEGEGYGYKKGAYLLRQLESICKEEELTIHQNTEGSWKPDYERTKIFLHALPFKPKHIYIDSSEVYYDYSEQQGKPIYSFYADNHFSEINVK